MERQTTVLIANTKEDLIPLVGVHHISGLDFDDEQMVGLPGMVDAVEQLMASSYGRLAKVDVGLHLFVALVRE